MNAMAQHIARKMAKGGDMAPRGGPPAAVIALGIKHAGGDGEEGEDGGDDGLPEGLVMASQDFVHAMHSGDAKAVAHAFHDMFQSCESAPHDEADDGEDKMAGGGLAGEEHNGGTTPFTSRTMP